PPYFRRMRQVNRQGPPIIGLELPGQHRYSAREVFERTCANCLILDARSKGAFAAAHIPGAINIPFGPQLPTWAGWVLPYDLPILVVLDQPAQMPEIATHLLRVGFEDLQGYLQGGIDAWQASGYPLATLDAISVQQLHERIRQSGKGLTVLDVRTEREWDAGHIDGA